MQNRSFLYRAIPKRKPTEKNILACFNKCNISKEHAKPANYFENCYIFNQPTFYSNSQAKKQVSISKPSIFKLSKEQKGKLKQHFKSLQGNKSYVQIKQKEKPSQTIHKLSNSCDMIHSRRKNRIFSAYFKQKQIQNNPQQRLQINALKYRKYAKKISFTQRNIQTYKTQRNKLTNRISKVLEMYPQKNFDINFITTKNQEVVLPHQEQIKMKNKMCRPWSPDKPLSTTIQNGSDLQNFIQNVE